MTDLIKNHSEVKSSVVKKMLDKNPAIVADNIEILHHEIDALGVEKPTLIAFGRTVEKHLRNNFKDYSIIYIPHYSAGGNNPNGRLNNRDNYKNEVRKILVREYPCSPWP